MKITTRYSGKSGLYVCVVPVKGMREVMEQLTPHLPDELELADDLHCTLMYSRAVAPHPLTVSRVLTTGDSQFRAVADCVKYWPGHDEKGYLVLCLHSEDLNLRHKSWSDIGAQHSFPDYQAHITLASGFEKPLEPYAIKNMNLNLRRGDFRVVLGGEHCEDIKE